jgi:quinohemoprotein ethanol dehydrogenase
MIGARVGTRPKSLILGALLVTLLALAGCQREAWRGGPGAIDDARMIRAASEPENWLVNGGTFNGEHYSTLDQINLQTINRLRPAWSFDFDTTRSQESEPIVVDGVMYVTTAWSKVYAISAATGAQIWRYDPQVSGEVGLKVCCDVVNRGAAVYKGRVYVGAIDGRLIALDAATGREVWSAQTVDPKSNYTITGAPRVVKDLVIIGNAGGDFGIRGYVSAYRADTGELAWRFYLAPSDPAAGPDGAASDKVMETLVRPTWSGEYWRYGGGANAWNAIVYDPEFDRLYIGTGNGSPWNPAYRTDGQGDNLFICSIVALDPDTGEYVWHYQENPQEAWDYNSVMPMILADLTIGGERRKVIMHAPKNGFFYVIDRANGRIISAGELTDVTWATGVDLETGRPVEHPNARYTDGPFTARPGTAGAHNWHPMAFSPRTGLVYLTVRESETTFRQDPNYRRRTDGVFNAGNLRQTRFMDTFLMAWDPVRQREAWRAPVGGGGVLATAGGLVFQGRGQVVGEFVAFRADTGQRVWSHNTPNGIVAGAVTYALDGEQYIAVTTGAGGGGMTGGTTARERQPGRVIAFKLDGAATLPPEPGPAPPANPSSERWTQAEAARGEATYAEYCARCHGMRAASSNVIPDLRRSAAVTDRALWDSIVVEGMLAPSGMVSFRGALSADDVHALRGYVSSQARQLQGEEANARQATVRAETGTAGEQ